ncbi:MAG: hypothetical protein OER22_04535 [Gammaproteobacteria bacterium]|nr:hypothetical protein [Gammaproteobacteria bacterium]MDH3372191.1 hypothetical protein [Gammaproteobacteria bacterium]MDH3409612.1 hypothetical protein [Gammaproteobacteria bacterium]MDH3551863.1 hypothetical protein [Gammaproteobacteria bacterium]
MHNVVRFVLQTTAYAAFAFAIGYLSFWPRYEYASPASATIKLSLSHATERVQPCVQLTPQQIAELAPNMRRSQSCERKRRPLLLELELDGDVVIELQAAPSGLWGDGPASVYERFDLVPGTHTITVRMRDSAQVDTWDYTHTEDVTLEAGRYLTITFRAENGGFRIR